MPEILTTLLTGTVAGAAGGLVAALVLRCVDSRLKRKDRKSQIAEIERMIVKYRTEIYDMTEDPHVRFRRLSESPYKQSAAEFERRQSRRGHKYDEFFKVLNTFLARKDAKLSFEEEDKIRGVLLRRFTEAEPSNSNPKWYVDTFEQAASIEWLQLERGTRDHLIFEDIERKSELTRKR